MLLLRQATVAVAMALACGEGACAMTDIPAQIPCTVSGSAKLDRASGSEQQLCDTVRNALDGVAGVRSVAITIQNPSRASAVITKTDGKQLPDVHVASSDGVLRLSSFAMLANGLAAQLKNEAGK